MSEIIAVALRLRLPLLPGWTAARRQAANWYRERLEGIAGLTLQDVSPDGESAYHLFVVTVSNRDRIADELKGAGISTGLHYPVPIHRQPAFSFLGHIQGDFPNAEWRADRLLSLPIYPGLSERQVERVCDVLGAAIESHRDE